MPSELPSGYSGIRKILVSEGKEGIKNIKRAMVDSVTAPI